MLYTFRCFFVILCPCFLCLMTQAICEEPPCKSSCQTWSRNCRGEVGCTSMLAPNLQSLRQFLRHGTGCVERMLCHALPLPLVHLNAVSEWRARLPFAVILRHAGLGFFYVILHDLTLLPKLIAWKLQHGWMWYRQWVTPTTSQTWLPHKMVL